MRPYATKPLPALMAYVAEPHEHISLVVRELPSGPLCWVRAKQATASAMGWQKMFDTEVHHRAKQSPDGTVQFTKKTLATGCGGRPMMIGLDRNHHRPAPQSRWRFRVSHHFTLLDCAELAHFTDIDWEWMTSPNGVKRTREQWHAIYLAGK